MQGLISYLPNCRQMKMTEKLSAARWAMMSAESLCPIKIIFVVRAFCRGRCPHPPLQYGVTLTRSYPLCPS